MRLEFNKVIQSHQFIELFGKNNRKSDGRTVIRILLNFVKTISKANKSLKIVMYNTCSSISSSQGPKVLSKKKTSGYSFYRCQKSF